MISMASSLCFALNVSAAAPGEDATSQGQEVEQLKHAKQLIKSGHAGEAYKTLLSLEDRYSGVPVYDYLLGVAALDSGNPSYAVFALQRALMINEGFVGAKIDLGRAYYKLGEFDNAEREFVAVLASKPSAKVSRVINTFLTQIKNGKPKQRRLNGQLIINTTAGFDSNANSASDENVFQDVTLSQTSQQIASPYYTTGINTNISYSLLPSTAVYSSANIQQRGNEKASFIDSRNMNGVVGLRTLLGRNLLNVNANYFRTYLAENFSGENSSAMISWAWMASKSLNFSSFYQYSMLRATPENTITNTNSHTASISLGYKSAIKSLPALNGALVYSRALALEAGSPYGRTMLGLNFGVSKQIAIKLKPQLSANGRVLQNSYEGTFSGLDRTDKQFFAGVGVGVNPLDSLSLSLGLNYTRNISSVSVYTYSRIDSALTMKWIFLQ